MEAVAHGRAVPNAAEASGRPRRTAPLQRHMVLLVLIAVLPLGLISGVIVAQHAAQERRDYGDQLGERAASVALALDREIEVITTALTVMATAPVLREGGDRSAYNARARAVEAALGNVLVLHDADEADSVATPGSLRAVFASGKPGIGRASERGAPLESGLPVFEPVVRNGRTVAVLEMGLTEPQISTVLATQNRGRDALAMVLDPVGFVAGTAGHDALPAGDLAPEWLRMAGSGGSQDPIRFGAWADGVQRICAVARPSRAQQWSVAVCDLQQRYESEWLGPLRERVTTLLGSLLLGIIAATAAARRFVHPLERLTARARAVARREEDDRDVPPSAVSEFEALRTSVRDAETALLREARTAHIAMLDARTTQRLLASVINGVTEYILVRNLDGRYVMMNQATRRDFGLDAADGDLVASPSPAILEEERAEIRAEDALVITTGEARSFEMEWKVRGITRQLALTKTPWRDATGQIVGVVTVARDVTENRLREARLRSLQADLLRATRLSSMGAMASGLAHEINQPLAAAANFLSAGLRLVDRARSGQGPIEPARSAVEDAKAQVLRAGAIVRRLRDFVARGETELRAEPIDDVIEEARALARADGADGGVPIVIAVDADTGSAMLDRTQMQQVLLNLIRNAAEAIATRPGGPRPGDCITLSAHRDAAGRVEIGIADTGPGLPAEIVGRLFQPFTSTKPDGLGIGLMICHTIIVGHGGTLRHTAGADGSARFAILLPSPLTHGRDGE